jgi:hypothetical protein
MRAALWMLGGVLLSAAMSSHASHAAPLAAPPRRLGEGWHRSPPPPPGKPPAAPAIATGARTFVALGGRPAPVRLAWPAVPNVARYRARWTQAGTVVDTELPGIATAFEREVVTAGHHQLSLIAIDAAGRESLPVEIGVDVVAIAAIVPGEGEPAPPNPTASPGMPAFAIGARFRSPGLACRLGDGPAGAEAAAREPGAMTLRCDGEAGPHVEVPVVIAPVIVDGPKRPLARGTATKVHLTVASVAQLGERLEVEADGDLSVADLQRTTHGLDLAVTPSNGATTAGLVVRSHGIQLARVELAIAPAPEAPPPPAPPESWLSFELGYHIGVLAPTDPPAIGTADKELVPGPLAGGRAGIFPTQRVGLEAELAVAALDYRGRGGRTQALVSARAHVAVRAVEHGRFGLRLLGGAGALRTSGEIHYGGALTFETHPNLWLRFQALDAITAAHDAGYAHCIELQLGVVTSLGRRDRGW